MKAGARSEQRINAIKDQFQSPNRNHLSQKFESQREEMNAKTEEVLKQRLDDRKRKEFEAKFFQEKQIAEKNQRKEL